ncbi:MAG: hypothetical protein ACXVCP_15010 [Bdellovibrio sp.]
MATFLLFSIQAPAETTLSYDALSDPSAVKMLLKYKLTDDYIMLGDVYLSNTNLGMRIESKKSLNIYWPSEVFRTGKLELIDRLGKVIFAKDITEDLLQTYTVDTDDEHRNFYHRVRIEIPLENQMLNSFKSSGVFNFCLSNKTPNSSEEICSSPFMFTQNGLVLNSKGSETKVLVNGQDLKPLEDEVPIDVKKDKPIQWYGQLASGLSWSFKEPVPSFKIIEILKLDRNLYSISGLGPHPLKYFTDHFTKKDLPFFYEYKPDPLFSEDLNYWVVNIQSEGAIDLNFMSSRGGIYTARVDMNTAPSVLQRPVILNSNNAHLTYSSKQKFVVSLPTNSSIKKNKNIIVNKDKTRFVWNIENLERGKTTVSSVTLKNENAEKSYFLETFRGYPWDVGFQYTISTISGALAHGGEFHASYWAEDFWSAKQLDWIRLRLGFQLKYFKPASKIPIDVNSSGIKKDVDVASTIFDVKYRFRPGLWGRDETFGLMLAYHQFTFDEYNLNLLGAGLFWARPMPKFFDEVFNSIPIFRYPKWVNAEFVSYLYNSNPNLQLNNTFHLNFYGKVNWTKTFYGDLGFGMRSYKFIDSQKNRQPNLDLFFLTMGVGFVF